MSWRLLLILSITTVLSFQIGRLAGKNTHQRLESSMNEILNQLHLIQEIHHMNHPKVEPTLSSNQDIDPNL